MELLEKTMTLSGIYLMIWNFLKKQLPGAEVADIDVNTIAFKVPSRKSAGEVGEQETF